MAWQDDFREAVYEALRRLARAAETGDESAQAEAVCELVALGRFLLQVRETGDER